MMMGSMIVHLTRLRSLFEYQASFLCAGMVCLGVVVMLWVGGTLVFAQGRFTDVLVSVVKDKVIAVTGVGQSEIDLSVGETVVSTKAQGLTALAITSTRLLGFASQLRHWGEQTLETDEHVNTSQVLRELCIVTTDQHLYGFQETLAHWTSEALGGSERVQELRAHGHLALAVTTERLVGFSAFMSGFHPMALQGDERVQSIEHTGDAFLVKTSRRTLMFRSRMAGWTEMS
jgi:hypothetical protein